jgi:hypothetical protein
LPEIVFLKALLFPDIPNGFNLDKRSQPCRE